MVATIYLFCDQSEAPAQVGPAWSLPQSICPVARAACQNRSMSAPAPPPAQPRNPLHGLTLEAILTALVAHYGWAGLAQRIPVRCFSSDPSIKSSLKFLRKTPWAREKVEGLYLFMQREIRRAEGGRASSS
jgi:hypothetical protein